MTHSKDQNATAESIAITAQTTFAPRTDSVYEELLSILSTIYEFQPDEVEPLTYTIDPDALNALVSPRSNGMPREEVRSVESEYGPHHIQVISE